MSKKIELIIKNLHGKDYHFETDEESTTVDLYRGVSELNQLYHISVEINSTTPIEAWSEEWTEK